MLNTRIITHAVGVAGALLIGSQAMAQGGPPAGPPGGLGVNVVNTPLAVTITNPTVPPSTVNVGNAVALATANAQALKGTPVAFQLSYSQSFAVPLGQRLVIEYISGSCETAPHGTVRVRILTSGQSIAHQFTMPVSSPQNIFASFGHVVKFYADPGSSVTFEGSNNVCDNLIFSGQLVTP